MQSIIKEGKSTSAVIAEFMKEKNVSLDDFKFEVIDEGSKGLFGLIGTKPTKIKFLLPDVSEKIKEYAEGILKGINGDYSGLEVTFKDRKYYVDIKSNDPGFLIGKEARMLDSIQHLLNQMINKQEKKKLRLRVDVDGYRERRKQALLDKVRDIISKVKDRGRSITMEPLHAANRRVVHQFVEKDKELRTMTIGDGEFKRVVILPSSASGDDIPKKRNNRRNNHRPYRRKKTANRN
ncbi:MAG: Jag N-terminal domain-containing protein [Candidatus Cloacimonetes bacterium]|nr:Jag N-terminal domain-containing protein [Candidatus Cloacimonadota bacterium]MCF7813154.1 Jag N-terminal domain-containing protein [Candidatus Cloacimonadota bacterium]MCF7867602.1 Jag N-terminal domain-containing protein [Candidatus Cloacimonadota bacterium]MCF7883123.1 Jag N-terminal domain-containing protein [Candidatus Cloacimonadota bacterium]